jgi:3-hydroxyacyl-CoA dehydrogenase
MVNMIANGQTGQKQGQGFYRSEKGQKQVIDLNSGEYGPAERLTLAIAEKAEKEGVIHLLNDDSLYGQFAWRVLSRTLSYAASIIPEIGNDPLAIDDAMKLGYNWIKGPFALMDEIGVDYLIDRLEREQRPVPEFMKQAKGSTFYRVEDGALQTRQFGGEWQTITRPDGVMRFMEKRQTLTPKNSNPSASWFDVDGVAIVEFHSKANALDAMSMAILEDALDTVENNGMRGLIVHNDAQHFSCGVNLQSVRKFFENEDMNGLDRFLDHFQQTVHRMAIADFPVVAAPVGLSLGGGFEVVLHAKQVICHANSNMGLVESRVGVIPGGGGCKETLYRWVEKLDCFDDITPACWKAFMSLGYAKTATSPVLARDLAMLRHNDRFMNNRDRILAEAMKAIADPSSQAGFDRPPIAMPGKPLFEEMKQWLANAQNEGKLLAHDVFVCTELARIVTGGEVEQGTLWSEQDFYDAERRSFLTLVATQETRDRIVSMLDKGAPIRN